MKLKFSKFLFTMGFNLRTILTAVCLQTLCNSYSRSVSTRSAIASSNALLKELQSDDSDERNRHIACYCTSIDRTDAEEQIRKGQKKPQRFIHPQVQLQSLFDRTERYKRHYLPKSSVSFTTGFQDVPQGTIPRSTGR